MGQDSIDRSLSGSRERSKKRSPYKQLRRKPQSASIKNSMRPDFGSEKQRGRKTLAFNSRRQSELSTGYKENSSPLRNSI